MKYILNTDNFWLALIATIAISLYFIIKIITIIIDINEKSLRLTQQSKVDHLLKSASTEIQQNILNQVKKELYFKKVFGIKASPKAIACLEQLYLSGYVTAQELKQLNKFLVLENRNYIIKFRKLDTIQAYYSLLTSLITLIFGIIYSFSLFLKTHQTIVSLLPITISMLAIYLISKDYIVYAHAKKIKHNIEQENK